VSRRAGQDVDAGNGEAERERIAEAARPDGSECDRPEELDRGDRAQGQPVDRLVEDRVHHAEHDPEPEQEQPARAVEPRERPPRTAPHGEDDRGGGDAEPGDAQHVDAGEEKDGEGGAEVVKDRAADEEGRGRRLGDDAAKSSAAGSGLGQHSLLWCKADARS
jgi:hypothetical protein